MIVDITGHIGDTSKSVPVATSNRIKLKYFHLPPLPLLDLFVDGVTVGGVPQNVPAVNSIDGLCDHFNRMTHGGVRIMHSWYDKSEFEICTSALEVTLSAPLATVLKMPTTLVPNMCYSSSVFEDIESLYSHYNVHVTHARGYHDGTGHNNIIAKVRRDGDISHAHFHSFEGATNTLEISISVFKRFFGTTHKYFAPDRWSVGFEIE
jgi:hypothetical protein